MLNKNILDFSDWLNWLNFNLQRQCNPEELANILLQNNFSKQSVEGVIFSTYPKLKNDQFNLSQTDYVKLPTPHFSHALHSSRVQSIESKKLQLYLIFDFLTPYECDFLTGLAKEELTPSSLTIPTIDKDFRTSKTAYFSPRSDSFIKIVDNKISKYMGISLEYSEPIQIQYYAVGQQFKIHTDFFEPNTTEYTEFAGAKGNRTWTFMVYLNNVDKGGETIFPNIDKCITPKQGLAVVWNNLYLNGSVNYDSSHAGLPIESGEKYVLTKWFREHKE